MPTHWTYDDVDTVSDLEQGDLIRPSVDIRQVLDRYHRYFSDDKYTLFIISTQSCDLVRRKHGPKASYITIAAVRYLREVAGRLLAEIAPQVGAGMFRTSGQNQWRDFLSRLFNQNEQNLGLFYLHKDADAGVDDDSVAFLRVTVALKTEHYETILAARAGRLRAEFRAKLGWLLGNLFARPATADWNEKPEGAISLKRLIGDYLSVPGNRWIDDVIVDAAQRKRIRLDGKTNDELESLRPKAPIDEAIDEVIKNVRSVMGRRQTESGDVTTGKSEQLDELLEGVRKRLQSSEKFKQFFSV